MNPISAICAEVTTPEATLQALQTQHPDIAVIDLSFGELNGLALIRRMHEIAPQVPVLVLSMHDEALFADRALKAGAKGYVMKHEAIASLVSAIRCVLSGRIYVSDQMAQQTLEGIRQNRGGGHDPVADLSDRELQVLTLIGRGLGTAAIAARLHVSPKTIETYRSHIKTKLHLRDRYRARALRHDLDGRAVILGSAAPVRVPFSRLSTPG